MENFAGPVFGLADRVVSLLLGALLIYWLGDLGHPEKSDRKRSLFFDFARGLAILCIVGIHSVFFIAPAAVLDDIIWFGLPLFVISSGYLLMRRYAADMNLKAYWTSILQRMIVPYVLYCLLLEWMAGQPLFSLQTGLDLLFGRLNGGNLYFVVLMLQFYVLFPLLRKVWKYLSHPIALLAIFFLSYWLFDLNRTLQGDGWNNNIYSLVFCARYLFYFIVGMWLSRHGFEETNLPKDIPYLALTVPLLLIDISFSVGPMGRPAMLPITMFILFNVFYHWMKDNALTKWLVGLLAQFGKYSFMIYLIHGTILGLVFYWVNMSMTGLHWGWEALFAATVLTTTLVSFGIGKIGFDAYRKVIDWMIGKKEAHTRRA